MESRLRWVVWAGFLKQSRFGRGGGRKHGSAWQSPERSTKEKLDGQDSRGHCSFRTPAERCSRQPKMVRYRRKADPEIQE